MAINVNNWLELDSDQISAAEDFLVDFLAAKDPSLDLTESSVLRQILVRPAAIFYALNQENIDRIRQSSSLKAINANPTLADDDIVDNVLSNYLITRKAGASAAGQARIILKANKFTPVTDSTVFSANGITFRPVRSFSGVSEATQVSTTQDRLITKYGSNQFSFIIEVVATVEGKAGNVPINTIFTSNTSQDNITTIVAASNFDGGDDTETNTELMGRLAGGISTRNLGSRPAIKSMLQTAFPTVKDLSIVGAGDGEMLRDRNNLLGISTLGKSDLYVRTRYLPASIATEKEATLIDVVNGTWQVNFQRDTDDESAIYEIRTITPKDAALTSLKILTVKRDKDVTDVLNVDIVPDMAFNAFVFSRYQTLAVTFEDKNTTGLTVGAKRDYVCTTVFMPEIAQISDYVLNRSVRHPCGDYLAKAPHPCFVAIELNIVLGPGDPDVDVEAIKAAISDKINTIDFVSGKLSADLVVSAVAPLLSGRTRLKLPISMRGRFLTNEADLDMQDKNADGTLWVFDSNEITAPNLPDKGITPRTVAFFCEPDAVSVTVYPSDHTAI